MFLTGASLVAQRVQCLPPVRETWVRSLGKEDSLEKDMATPLQYSCLENLMDGEAWWAIYIVHGVAESRTLLSDFTFTFMFLTEALILAKHHEKLDIGDLIPYFKSGNIINFSSRLQEGPYKPFTFGNLDAIKLSEIPRKMNFHFFFFQTFFFHTCLYAVISNNDKTGV